MLIKAMLKEAEMGSFLSKEEYKKEFDKWRKQITNLNRF